MKRMILLLVFLSLACQWSTLPATSSPVFTDVVPTSTPSATQTSSPYEEYTVDALRARTYGGGSIEVLETMEETDSFTRYSIRYPSDGLNIYGFANVPKGDGPFPIIIVIHGFVDVSTYQTLDYTTPAADKLTQAGYIVIHPNLRGYPPSDNGDNFFRVGMAVDVLNLIALIRANSGPSELFSTAALEKIGLWGHSLGGNIALRVLTVLSDIKATVLYASMSGDETKNTQLLSTAFEDQTLQTELEISPSIMEHISPMFYYSDITSPIQLHHGTVDDIVPIDWAEETCKALTNAGVQIECIYYPDEDHTFRSRVADEFYGKMINFYEKYLSP